MAHHVQCHSHNVYITGTLSVAEQGSFHSVRPGQDTELGIADTTAAVIVRMNAQYDVFTIF